MNIIDMSGSEQIKFGDNIRSNSTTAELSKIVSKNISYILPEDYIKKLKELFDISLILKSENCSNYDAYSTLFIKKYVEITQQGDKIIEQISNANLEQLQEFINIIEKQVEQSIDFSKKNNVEKDLELWESVKAYLHQGNFDMIKNLIVSRIAYNTDSKYFDGWRYKTCLEYLEQLSEEQLRDAMKLDVDSELKEITDSVLHTKYSKDFSDYLALGKALDGSRYRKVLDEACCSFIHDVYYKIDPESLKTNSSPKL